jgi:hypothetical protein
VALDPIAAMWVAVEGSAHMDTIGPSGQTLYEDVDDGINAFFQDPNTAGLGFGLRVFVGTDCSATTLAFNEVTGFGILPGAESTIYGQLLNNTLREGSPLEGGVLGIIGLMNAYVSGNPGTIGAPRRPAAVAGVVVAASADVCVTDGTELGGLVSGARPLASLHAVSLAPELVPTLSEVAVAGGGTLAEAGNGDEIAAALAAVRDTLRTPGNCGFRFPEGADPGLFQLRRDGAEVPFVGSSCADSPGWALTDDPAEVVLCGMGGACDLSGFSGSVGCPPSGGGMAVDLPNGGAFGGVDASAPSAPEPPDSMNLPADPVPVPSRDAGVQ